MLLYSLLLSAGYEDMTLDQIKKFRQLGARPPGHPEYGHAPKASRRPPGRSARASAIRSASPSPSAKLAAEFGRRLVDHHTWVLAGDGCLMEGMSARRRSRSPGISSSTS
jgi:transketolase